MKWEKLGQLFEFGKSPFKDRFIGYAQSPQAVVFDEFIRIYFSTRIIDSSEKFLSIPQFVDYDKNLKSIINYSDKSIIELGSLGSFNEHGIFPFSPFQHEGKIYSYTTGWTRRVSVNTDSGIGYALGDETGSNFLKFYDGPVLTISLFEPFLVCDGFVRYFGDKYHMWYIYGTKWSSLESEKQPERTYVIGHAVSQDGLIWEKEGRQIIEQINEYECQALPTVINIGNRYHMYFCYRHSFDFRQNVNNSYKLGYAYSDDLINWVRNDDLAGIEQSQNEWDSDMMCYPNLFQVENNIYLLYNGNNFGKEGFGLAILKND